MRLKTHIASTVAFLMSVTGVSAMTAPSATAVPANFYSLPASIPSTPGAVITSRASPLLLQSPGIAGQWPAQARTVKYSSKLQDGTPTAVTGTILEPTAAWTGRGERPTLVLAPGTVGQGDQCAPSKLMATPLKIDLTKPSVAANYEEVFAYGLVSSGYRVMMTDYIGLGTPGVHTYVNRVEEGHAVLDAARAALSLSGAKPDAPVGFWGYSQGGGAAASAAEMASSYAPELHVKATYAGAPPADLSKVVKAIDGTSIVGAIGYAINGIVARYPEVTPILDKEISPRGEAALKALAGQCIGDTILQFGFQRTSSWTRTGKLLSQIIAGNPIITKVVDEQRIGRLKPNAPVMVSTGVNDDVIPHGQVLQLVSDWRAQGANVALVNDGTPPIFTRLGANHALPDVLEALPAWNFINQHFR